MAIEREVRMIDIVQSEGVEVQIDNKFIWINVDGFCRFRASIEKCTKFIVEDNRGRC